MILHKSNVAVDCLFVMFRSVFVCCSSVVVSMFAPAECLMLLISSVIVDY